MAIGTSPAYHHAPCVESQQHNNHHARRRGNISILCVSFLAILATGGPTYSFGVYSAALKDTLHLTQSQLETLGAASFATGFFSWIPGLAVDAWGSRTAIVLGGVAQFVGLSLYWLVARSPPVWLPSSHWWIPVLSMLSMVSFAGNNLVSGGVFKEIVVSCGKGTKGKAIGAAKGYLGLGAGVYSSLFSTTTSWSTNDLDFLAMSACLAMVAIVIPAVVGLPKNMDDNNNSNKGSSIIQDESTALHYNIVYSGLGVLALVVLGTSTASLVPQRTTDDDGASSFQFALPAWLAGALILVSWVGPILSLLLIPTASSRRIQKEEQDDVFPNEQVRLLAPRPSSSTMSLTTFEEEDEPIIREAPVEDLTLTEMLQTLPALLFLGASTILVGSGTMLTINMGQMVQSLGFPSWTASTCLAIFSVAQATSRVLAGAVSEAALQWKTPFFFGSGVPRTAFLVLCCLLAVVGHFVLALSSGDSFGFFVMGVFLTGISFGGVWPLMVLIVGDLFGTGNHGANYMFMDGFTSAVGSLTIAKFLTQSVYEQNVGRDDDDTACYGTACFGFTHVVVSGLCFGASLACVWLLYMTRSSYGGMRSSPGA